MDDRLRGRNPIGRELRGSDPAAGAVRACAASRPDLQPGFTLIEMLVVVTVIGILVGMAAPKIDATEFRMRGAVREVGTTLLAAQGQAVMRQHDVVVAIDTVGRRLRVHSDADNDGVVDEGEAVRTVELAEVVAFGRGSAPARPIGAAAVVLTRTQAGAPAITFHRDGSANEEGGFYLTSRRSEGTAMFATDAYAVEIARSTGRAAWYRFGGSRWERRF